MIDDEVKSKILEVAKEEFLNKGYLDASMRNIALKANLTTGSLYNRFADKNEIFNALVKNAGDKLLSYFKHAQQEFATFTPQNQLNELHSYVDFKVKNIVDIIYSDFDAFKLIVCSGYGSSYEYFIDEMIDIETENTFRFIDDLKSAGIKINNVRHDFAHIIASSLFNGMFEVVRHDLSKEDALIYIRDLENFFKAGWDIILGI